eukprot:Rhum_TRINITY_DN15092_c2_g2::Rhum_TRINITY_DN15092_c2_g2_i1::g.137630::m.137630
MNGSADVTGRKESLEDGDDPPASCDVPSPTATTSATTTTTTATDGGKSSDDSASDTPADTAAAAAAATPAPAEPAPTPEAAAAPVVPEVTPVPNVRTHRVSAAAAVAPARASPTSRPPRIGPRPASVMDAIVELKPLVLAGVHSPVLLGRLLREAARDEDRRNVEELSSAVVSELEKVGGGAQLFANSDEEDEEEEEDEDECGSGNGCAAGAGGGAAPAWATSAPGWGSCVLTQYRLALMGSHVADYNGVRIGLHHNNTEHLELFLTHYPSVDSVYHQYLVGEGAGEDGETKHMRSMRAVNELWQRQYGVDASQRPHPSETQPPPVVNDEQKISVLLRVNLALKNSEEQWLPLVDLRDNLISRLAAFLATPEFEGEHLSGKIQTLVWRLQNELTCLNPKMCLYDVWRLITSRVEFGVEQVHSFVEALDAEKRKRYSSGGMWSRLVGTLRTRAGSRIGLGGSHSKSASDDAFDQMSECHRAQAGTLTGILEEALQKLSSLKPPDPPLDAAYLNSTQ